MEIWHNYTRSTTGRYKIMTKIVVRLPEPKPEYDISNQKQINRALTTVVEQLNSTFLETEKEEQQRFNFFLS